MANGKPLQIRRSAGSEEYIDNLIERAMEKRNGSTSVKLSKSQFLLECIEQHCKRLIYDGEVVLR